MFYAFVLGLIATLFVGAMIVDLRSRNNEKATMTYKNVKPGDTENYLAGDNKYLNSGS
ncbi:MAG: hypothetical protein ABS882_12680 [Lysinibacillus sp.]